MGALESLNAPIIRMRDKMLTILESLTSLTIAHRERYQIALSKAQRLDDSMNQKAVFIASAIAHMIALNAIEAAIAQLSLEEDGME